MMNYKSKKSKRYGHIKTGMAGIIAMAVIVIIVLLVNSATLNSNVVIKYAVPLDYTTCIMAEPNIHMSQVNCEADGLKQCRYLNPGYDVPISQANMCLKKCEWYVKDSCRNAPIRFPLIS